MDERYVVENHNDSWGVFDTEEKDFAGFGSNNFLIARKAADELNQGEREKETLYWGAVV